MLEQRAARNLVPESRGDVLRRRRSVEHQGRLCLDRHAERVSTCVAAFIGPAAVERHARQSHQPDVPELPAVAAVTKNASSTSYNYYNASWGMMTLLLMTGNFVVF